MRPLIRGGGLSDEVTVESSSAGLDSPVTTPVVVPDEQPLAMPKTRVAIAIEVVPWAKTYPEMI